MKEDNKINKFDKNAKQLTKSDLAGVSGGTTDDASVQLESFLDKLGKKEIEQRIDSQTLDVTALRASIADHKR